MLRLTRSIASLNTMSMTLRPMYECMRKVSSQQQQHEMHEDEELPKQEMDDFTREFLDKRIKITQFQRLLLAAGSSVTALLDPARQDMIACLGETTGEDSLKKMLKVMQSTAEGQEILSQKPRINTKTVDLNELQNLPEDTFGFQYFKFLEVNQVTPDSRLDVRFMDDPQLAYAMTRYRETHDLVHTILGMPTNMLGEVAVKWVEAINIGLPMCYGGALFGAMRLRPKQRHLYRQHYLHWAIETGRQVKPLISVYWEKRWSQKIEDLRKELNIKAIELPGN